MAGVSDDGGKGRRGWWARFCGLTGLGEELAEADEVKGKGSVEVLGLGVGHVEALSQVSF